MHKLDPKYEALFTPWKVGNVEIKNRIVMCPMGGTSLFGWFELGGCHFDKEAAKLFLERANNNVGLIIPGIAPLRDTFWGKWLWQNPKMFEELKVFMDEIQNHITTVAIVTWIHCYLAKIIFELRVNNGECAKAIPKVVECIKCFCTCF